VIKGQGLGSKEFVPTINLKVSDFLIPQEGVYITKTVLNECSYPSVSFIGHRVTTDGKFAVETSILDNKIDGVIPKNVQIEFLKKIRDNKKYDKFDDLKKQIKNDIEVASFWFQENK